MIRKPIIALMYDFDKTLCTKDMQEYSFIPSLGLSSKKFWNEVQSIAESENMDNILCYLYLMLKKAGEKGVSVTRENFVKLGKDIEYFPGVEDWFKRINEYGKKSGVIIEHYIISSGIKEIIEGSSIAKQFKEIFACEFLYDENHVAIWPKAAVNYTAKTQFLFRINKGVLELYKDKELNEYTADDNRRVPFRNMIYIGDGMTDVPCMKLVKANGGQSIAVFRKRKKDVANRLLDENRVDYITEANYCENSELDKIVKVIIDKMAVTDKLVKTHAKHVKTIASK